MKNRILISIILAAIIATPIFSMDPKDESQTPQEKTYNLPNQEELDRQLMDAITAFEIDPKQVERLLIAGANPNGGQFKAYEDKPLFMIITLPKDTRIALCKHLLNHGANVDGLDRRGHRTPLLAAALRGCSETANLVLAHKANVNYRHQSSGFPPIHFACASSGNSELVKTLIEHKAHVNDQSNRIHLSPLMRAAVLCYGQPKIEICKMLLASKADTMAICRDGNTALIKAAQKQNEPVCRLLVNAAKNPSILAFLTCLRRTDRTNTLYKHRNEFFRQHFQNGKPLELLGMKNKKGQTAFDLMPLAWLEPEFSKSGDEMDKK